MKKVILLMLFIILVAHITVAQPWMANVKPDSSRNFYAIKKAFDNYWAGNKPVIEKGEKEESETPGDGSYLQFERWANFIEPRVFPSGNLFDPTILQKEFEKYKSDNLLRSFQITSPTWTFIGPQVVPGGGGGAGRINCISIVPSNTNTIFAGAASGGLWVTNDGGITWSTATDLLPALSIADIAINPNNPDTMYVATGDGYGYIVPEGNASVFWGGTYTAGVMKSTDGGNTWNTTGLGYTDDSLDIIQRLLISPNNPNILLAATTNGIYRTTNAAATWARVYSGHFFDLAFNTANADTVYAVDTTDIYKSTDAGATWLAMTQNLFPSSDRITIATTPVNTKLIYVINSSSNSENLYKSTNGGKSFSALTYPSAANFYGYYDLVMSASPTNENTLYCGGEEIVKSTDGGNTWNVADNANSYTASNYVHVDKHAIVFYPNSNSEVLCGNDGGLFKTTNGAVTWSDLSNGLAIKQYYRLSSSASNADYIYAGAQDNGTDRYNGSSWQQVYGADGMQPLVDYTSDQINYASYEYGELFQSTDGGNTFNDITPSNAGFGNWTTPYVLNPMHNNTIIAGYNDIFSSYDAGNTWTDISGNSITPTGGSFNSLVIAPSDTNYIYAATYGDIIKTNDDGNTWTDITGSLPVSQSAITWIAVSSYNPQKIWVTLSGYQDTLKVFASKDGGNTWTNYSGTLPNIPVDCIAYQPNSKDVLYIGTDFGVYLRDSTMNDWTTYNTGLPNVIINQIEILPYLSMLRVATYGRGIWETGLYDWVTGIASTNAKDNINIFPNPSGGLVTVEINSQQGDNLLLTVVNELGQKVYETQKQVTSGDNQFELDLSRQAKGLYFICISSSTQSAVKKIALTD